MKRARCTRRSRAALATASSRSRTSDDRKGSTPASVSSCHLETGITLFGIFLQFIVVMLGIYAMRVQGSSRSRTSNERKGNTSASVNSWDRLRVDWLNGRMPREQKMLEGYLPRVK
jgi:hypothetical protein